jgi:hypothetical protein
MLLRRACVKAGVRNSFKFLVGPDLLADPVGKSRPITKSSSLFHVLRSLTLALELAFPSRSPSGDAQDSIYRRSPTTQLISALTLAAVAMVPQRSTQNVKTAATSEDATLAAARNWIRQEASDGTTDSEAHSSKPAEELLSNMVAGVRSSLPQSTPCLTDATLRHVSATTPRQRKSSGPTVGRAVTSRTLLTPCLMSMQRSRE